MQILRSPTVLRRKRQMERNVEGLNGAVGIDELQAIALRRRQRLQTMTTRTRGRGGGGGGVFAVGTQHLVTRVEKTTPLIHVEGTHAGALGRGRGGGVGGRVEKGS